MGGNKPHGILVFLEYFILLIYDTAVNECMSFWWTQEQE